MELIKTTVLYLVIMNCILYADVFDELLNDFNKDNNISKNNNKFRHDLLNLGKSHRYDLNRNDIRFQENQVIIETNCRRTNVQSTLIKTYWLFGHTLNNSNLYFSKIIIILHVSRKDNILITSASGYDVLELGCNSISNYNKNKEFLKKIDVYKKNK